MLSFSGRLSTVDNRIRVAFCKAVNKIYLKSGLVKSVSRGARYLTGENLKVVWAEFSTFS
jgi:hypothetical protein